LADLADAGHSDAVLWRGQRRSEDGKPGDAEETVGEILAKADLWTFNEQCQANLDDVTATLTEELGLAADDVVRVPVAFEDIREDGISRGAAAYFLDMVNHLVLGNISVVPRP
jgi:protein-arginine deiminase